MIAVPTKKASVKSAEIEYQRLSPRKYGTKLNKRKLAAAKPKTIKIQLMRMSKESMVKELPKVAKTSNKRPDATAATDKVTLK